MGSSSSCAKCGRTIVFGDHHLFRFVTSRFTLKKDAHPAGVVPMTQRILCLGLIWLGLAKLVSSGEPWPQWRGPRGDGHVVGQPLPPLTFSRKDVLWKTRLPGSGQSSPVVWDDRIFLTAYFDQGAERIVFALDRETGELLWQETAWMGKPEPSHQMNGWASSTCATDGERVYAFFGRGGGLFCYTKEGELVWNRPLGEFEGPWGTAASPILYENLVIQNCDSESDARLVALDKFTGEEVWSTDREDYRGWSTPYLYRKDDRVQLLLNGHSGVRAYDPHTGLELWFCSSEKGRGEPTVTPDEQGRVIVLNGLAGALYAVLPDGMGDVSQTKRLWQAPRRTGRDLPSPVVVNKSVLVMAMKGILSCYDTENGKLRWEERVGGNFSASPVVAGDKALFLAEHGEVVVIDLRAFEHVVARNTFGAGDDEVFRASMAAHKGQWLIRSDQVLYCIGPKSP